MPSLNPILPGFNPDPTICRVGPDYFLATSTFEYFPGIPLYHSQDLINWTLIGHALNRPSQLWLRSTSHGDGVYAPTIRYWKGRWYIACSIVTDRKNNIHGETRGFIISTDDIWDETKWTEPTYIDMVGIDQDLFFDDDDKVYLCTARLNGGKRQPAGSKLATYCSQIDLTTGRCLTRPVLLWSSKVQDFISGIAEGPHIIKRDGWYYLFVAECGPFQNHQERVYRSTSLLGPYEDPGDRINPVLFQPDSTQIQRAGHADLVQAEDGRWWAVFLGIRTQANEAAQLGRETFLCPVDWTEDGWPVFNGREDVALTLAPEMGLPDTQIKPWSEDWRSEKLSLGWYHLRTPVKQEYSLTHRPHHLTLWGSIYTIHHKESPCMLLRKQTALAGTWETELDFIPETEYEEAGTAVFLSNTSWIAWVIRKKGDRREVVLRWPDEVTDEIQEIAHLVDAASPVRFLFHAEPTSYTCSYQLAGQAKCVDVKTLSSKVIVRDRPWETTFTGTHFGLFAQGSDGESCLTPAHFGETSFKHGSACR